MDSRIAIWKKLVQDSSSIDQRIDNLISALLDRYDLYKQNALVLFLRVLSDREIELLKSDLLEVTVQVEDELIDESDSTEREMQEAVKAADEIEKDFERMGGQKTATSSFLDALVSPFEYERAEENRRAVFLSDRTVWNIAFWGGTRLFSKLRKSTDSHIILGATGSGKTSLALGVYYYLTDSHRAVFANKISELTILVQVALLILNTILSDPKRFYRLHRDEQEFLLLFLMTHLPHQALEIRAQHKIKQLLSLPANVQQRQLQESGLKLTDYVKLNLRITHFPTQYKLPHTPALNSMWKYVLSEMVAMIGVTHLKVILDLSFIEESNETNQSTLQDELPFLSTLCEQSNVAVCLLLPENLGGRVEGLNLPVDYLTWTKREFVCMLESRYRAFVGRRHWPGEYFENDEAFEFLVTGSKLNPSRFSQLWKIVFRLAALDAPEFIKVTQAHINAALNHLHICDIMP